MEFTPEHKVLNDLFGNDLTYIIPTYQRPYSWSARGKSDNDNQVNTMWEDLMNHFKSDSSNIYFLGSMVLIGEVDKREFEVVDGQQRLTTLALLFVAIKCMLGEIKDEQIESKHADNLKEFRKNALDNINTILFNRKLFGVQELEKKVKIQSLSGFDYDKVFKTALECGTYKQLPTNGISNEQEKISKRYFDNRDYFISKLKDSFLDKGIFTFAKAEQLNNFIAFLKNKVTIVRIISQKFETAYQIFEILNNRGLPLSNKDMFRNFMISEMHKDKIADAEEKWKELDNSDYDLTPEFISRYVESKNAKKQRYSAFNDIQEIYKRSFQKQINRKKAEIFHEDIKINLAYYTNIKRADFGNKKIKNRILFLQQCDNSGKVVNLLLALFRNVDDENNIIQFLSELEIFILYFLLSPKKRFQTKRIFGAIEKLNSNDFDNAVKKIELEPIEKSELNSLIQSDITDNGWAKLLLAGYVWAKDMNNDDDVVDLDLKYREATLEHIIPQNPENNTNWKSDFSLNFRKKYTYKLGNMTLLTQKMNSKAKNYDFSKKKNIYKNMKLSITTELGNLTDIDEQFIANRHKQITDYLIQHYGL